MLASALHLQVLNFQGIERAWGGFDASAGQEAFERRLKNYLGIWCCVNRHPGHVW